MYIGELNLGVLAVTELRIRLTAQGLALESQAVLKKRDGIGPTGTMTYPRTSNWSRSLIQKATELVEMAEREMGEELGRGSTQSTDEEPEDLAGALQKGEGMLPKQF